MKGNLARGSQPRQLSFEDWLARTEEGALAGYPKGQRLRINEGSFHEWLG